MDFFGMLDVIARGLPYRDLKELLEPVYSNLHLSAVSGVWSIESREKKRKSAYSCMM